MGTQCYTSAMWRGSMLTKVREQATCHLEWRSTRMREILKRAISMAIQMADMGIIVSPWEEWVKHTRIVCCGLEPRVAWRMWSSPGQAQLPAVCRACRSIIATGGKACAHGS